MSAETFLKAKGAVTVIAAVALLAFPFPLAALVGVELTQGTAVLARLLGAIYLAVGPGIYLAGVRSSMTAAEAYRSAMGEAVATAALIYAMTVGGMNWVGWVLVAAYAYYALGFLYVAKKADA